MLEPHERVHTKFAFNEWLNIKISSMEVLYYLQISLTMKPVSVFRQVPITEFTMLSF